MRLLYGIKWSYLDSEIACILMTGVRKEGRASERCVYERETKCVLCLQCCSRAVTMKGRKRQHDWVGHFVSYRREVEARWVVCVCVHVCVYVCMYGLPKCESPWTCSFLFYCLSKAVGSILTWAVLPFLISLPEPMFLLHALVNLGSDLLTCCARTNGLRHVKVLVGIYK